MQQTNKQNAKLAPQASQGQIFVDQEATPQEFDQRQPQNMRNQPEEPTGGPAGGRGGGGRIRPKLKCKPRFRLRINPTQTKEFKSTVIEL